MTQVDNMSLQRVVWAIIVLALAGAAYYVATHIEGSSCAPGDPQCGSLTHAPD